MMMKKMKHIIKMMQTVMMTMITLYQQAQTINVMQDQWGAT